MSTIGYGIMLCLMTSNLSCASASEILVPTLENRTLWIDPDRAGFFYNHEECKKRGVFGNCREWETKTDFYDLTNPAVRKELIDTGFVAITRRKRLP